MKYLVHIHRADRPGKGYWASNAPEGCVGLIPTIESADAYSKPEIRVLADILPAQFGTRMEFMLVPEAQPDLVPKRIRALLGV